MHCNVDIYENQPKDALRLWAAKPPLAGESCASWIQRLCGDHQYSFPVFSRILEFTPYRGDWDRYLNSEVWLRLMRLVDVLHPMSSYEEILLLGSLFQVKKRGGIMWFVDGKAAYKWCSLCLAGDEIPYLRWYWRVSDVHECWVHQEPLSERCLVCDQALFLHRACLSGRFASSLSECAFCGMSLAVPERQEKRYDRDLQIKIKALFSPWWLSGTQPSIDTATRLAAKYHYIVNDRMRLAILRYRSNLKRRGDLHTQTKSWVLDARSFERGAGAVAVKPTELRVPWQWKLGPKQRLAIADALWAIRNELRVSKIDRETAS